VGEVLDAVVHQAVLVGMTVALFLSMPLEMALSVA
jgi:hypothetical protein